MREGIFIYRKQIIFQIAFEGRRRHYEQDYWY